MWKLCSMRSIPVARFLLRKKPHCYARNVVSPTNKGRRASDVGGRRNSQKPSDQSDRSAYDVAQRYVTEDEVPANAAHIADITDIEEARAHRFLDQIRNDPFVALVKTDEGVSVYVRADLSASDIQEIQNALAELIEKEGTDGKEG